MKTIIQYILLSLFTISTLTAQNNNPSINLSNADIISYEIELTHNKTTHILFPSSIDYVDLGSNEIIANKVEVASNVLRLKTTKEDTVPTNFTVITNQGKYYSFNVTYNKKPTQLSYDLTKFEKQKDKQQSEVLLKNLGNTSPSLTDLLMKAIVKRNKKELNIKNKNNGVEARLKSIYTQDDKLYFHLSIHNKSHLPYTVDFITFKIKDKKTVKRATIQETTLQPIRSFTNSETIHTKGKQDYVFLFDQFTLSDKQMLLIEIKEKKGIRTPILKVKSSDITKIKNINTIRL